MMNRAVSLGLLLAGAAIAADDPFADVRPQVAPAATEPAIPWWRDNWQVRRELYGVVAGGWHDLDDTGRASVRLSAGFEVQKRLATATRTLGAVDYQGRVVYREHSLNATGDAMGMDAARWTYETHNAYFELYNVAGELGRLNLRAGRFYVPFGLSWQTDTHGTLLQLANERVFGDSHDWQVTAYGNATELLDYQVGYVFGAGPRQHWDGQSGMAVGRLGLNNTARNERGREGGISAAYGQRLDPAVGAGVVDTWRVGVDARQRLDTGGGPITLTGEGAAGEDDQRAVWSGLLQADWLHPSRRWGAAAQYTYFTRRAATPATQQSAALVATRYFRNEVGNTALHWLAVGVENRWAATDMPDDTLLLAQYYHYW
ncbi:MAG TPA: hypothetical protein PLT37_08690 [Kiritimatiellia bacterium]|jgi:hypothetical protein|nr:hypothetical protein [Kiritimatiellia bacterium]MBP9572219.1 hypothetical protein [Kiritimatiellia bacterium]OQC59386.1 MAG: hypothetical protein BWX54_00653 [Verrucomicrobia bacterium ADurb.Bin018]HQF21301.1 hypothetical protein [Kiritimatiellia bacterium]HQG74314.1 hypothetical protein [Kiritimatiellia bacterium]